MPISHFGRRTGITGMIQLGPLSYRDLRAFSPLRRPARPGARLRDVVASDSGTSSWWRSARGGAVTREDVTALEGKARAVARELGHTARIHLVLFAGAPIHDPRVEEARRDGRVHIIDLPTLFG